jgi:cytochrome c
MFAVVTGMALSGAAMAQDAGNGAVLFKRCAVCHSVKAGAGPSFGPVLAGIVGRKAGSQPGFLYSSAMTSSGIVWDAATLDAFIAKPQSVVKGTRMTFPGLPDVKDRADLIAYLATLN